jgi:hypothetical protein
MNSKGISEKGRTERHFISERERASVLREVKSNACRIFWLMADCIIRRPSKEGV